MKKPAYTEALELTGPQITVVDADMKWLTSYFGPDDAYRFAQALNSLLEYYAGGNKTRIISNDHLKEVVKQAKTVLDTENEARQEVSYLE